MKIKIYSILPTVFLIMMFCLPAFSQALSKDLAISIELKKKTDSEACQRVKIRIENKTAETIRFSDKNATLAIKPIGAKENLKFSQEYFAFVKIGVAKIKSGRIIEIEAQLDTLHWYPSNASHYFPSIEPNLKEIIGTNSGDYHLSAAADIESKNKRAYPTFYRTLSDLTFISFRDLRF